MVFDKEGYMVVGLFVSVQTICVGLSFIQAHG